MAISKPLVVSINQDRTRPNEKMFIYRNDFGVDMYIDLSNLTYKFDGSKNFKYANALFKTPSGEVHAINSLGIIEGKIKFSFTQDIVTLMQELGKYELQFQLFDSEKNRLTIPSYYFEVKEPLGNTSVDMTKGVVDYARVDYSYIEDDTTLFAIEDGYIKTTWITGDIISSQRMNNIENGIEMAINKEIEMPEVIYTSNKPSTVAIGGIPLGYTSNGISIVELLDNMLHPYKEPVISLSASPNTTLYELGNTISTLRLTVSVTQGSDDITKVALLKDGTTIATSTSNISNTQSNIKSDTTYSSYVTDGTKQINSNSISIKFINPIYIGSLSDISATNIKAMTKKIVNPSSQSYTYNITNKRMCIAIPSNWSLKTIIDPNSFDITQSFTETTANIYCLDGMTRTYTIYYSGLTSQSNFTVKFNF